MTSTRVALAAVSKHTANGATVERIGEQLRDARVGAGLSLRETARRAHLNPGYLSQIEHGTRLPSAQVLAALARVLALDLAALSAEAVNGAIDRERLAYAAAHPRRIDQAAVDALSATLGAQRRLEDVVGAEAVLPAVNGAIATMQHLVREARGSVRPAMLAMGAQWAQFAGWLNTTTLRHGKARGMQDLFLSWAVETGDADLTATALSVKGHLAWTQGDYPAMSNLSAAASRYRRASPAVLAAAVQQGARAHALLSEADEAERMLDRADALAARAVEQPDGIPPWMYFHSTELLELQRGLAYSYLAVSVRSYRRKAIEHLTAGLSRLDSETRETEWIAWYVARLDELTGPG